MTTPLLVGTMSPLARSALVLRLRKRPALQDVPIGYTAPKRPSDLKSPIGDLRAIWLNPARTVQDADTEQIVVRSLPIEIDETFEFGLCVQAIETKTGAGGDEPTQERVEAEAAALLGECFATIAEDPSLGIDPGLFLRFDCLPRSWQLFSGALPQGRPGYGARYEAVIRCQARLGFPG